MPEPTTEAVEPVEVPPATPEVAVETPIVVVTDPAWDASRTTIRRGSSFTLTGSGYEPGQNVLINLGIAQTDVMVMGEQSAIADAAGNYLHTITVAPDLEPRTYAVLTMVRDGVEPGPDVEATKQYAIIEVVAG